MRLILSRVSWMQLLRLRNWETCIIFLVLNFTEAGMTVTQHKFTLDLLTEFDCLHHTSVVSPLDLNHKLYHDQGALLEDPSLYRKLVGKLNFLTHTRPDISFSVQHWSQFMAAPWQPRWDSAIHVLCNLSNNPAQGLFYSSFLSSTWQLTMTLAGPHAFLHDDQLVFLLYSWLAA